MTPGGNRLAWLLSLALAAAGVLASHGLAYRIVEPNAERRHHLLEETGHGYLSLDLAGSLLAALVIVGFAGCVLGGARRGDAPEPWIFALAPPAGFALQEHAELLIHTHAFGPSPVLAPTFLVGLALQIPFAVMALLAARALLAAAGALATRFGLPPRLRLAPDASLEVPVLDWRPSAPTLLGARGQRAPPADSALRTRTAWLRGLEPREGGEDHPPAQLRSTKPLDGSTGCGTRSFGRTGAERLSALGAHWHSTWERRRRPGVAR